MTREAFKKLVQEGFLLIPEKFRERMKNLTPEQRQQLQDFKRRAKDMTPEQRHEEAAKLPGVAVLNISMDLPFAQRRWCGAAGVKALRVFSDYQKGDFGKAYGVLIKELRLLARAVFIVDRDGIVKYAQVMPEAAKEPNYEEVLHAVKALL